MRRVHFETRQVVFEPHQAIDMVYFPVSGVISLVTITPDGSAVSVASVGAEGMAGLPVFFGETRTANLRAVAQMPGSALMLPAAQFRHCVQAPGRLRELIGRYANALLTQAAQEVACNRRHSVRERASCWLLVTADRARSLEFPMTQEFLAELLGTRRASVVTGMQALQRQGVIRYRRGRIRIVDRAGLEGCACDCYAVIRSSLLPAAGCRPQRPAPDQVVKAKLPGSARRGDGAGSRGDGPLA
jgi:CRP-like cAMP-binding protein